MKIELKFKEDPIWDDITQQAIEIGMEKAVIFVKNQAKTRAPVDTGRLKNSISGRVTIGVKQIEGEVFTDVEYAPYIEFGTERAKAQPFLRPALYGNEDKITTIISREMGARL